MHYQLSLNLLSSIAFRYSVQTYVRWKQVNFNNYFAFELKEWSRGTSRGLVVGKWWGTRHPPPMSPCTYVYFLAYYMILAGRWAVAIHLSIFLIYLLQIIYLPSLLCIYSYQQELLGSQHCNHKRPHLRDDHLSCPGIRRSFLGLLQELRTGFGDLELASSHRTCCKVLGDLDKNWK